MGHFISTNMSLYLMYTVVVVKFTVACVVFIYLLLAPIVKLYLIVTALLVMLRSYHVPLTCSSIEYFNASVSVVNTPMMIVLMLLRFRVFFLLFDFVLGLIAFFW